MDVVLTWQVSGCGVEHEHFPDILKAQRKLAERLQCKWHYKIKPIMETFKDRIEQSREEQQCTNTNAHHATRQKL